MEFKFDPAQEHQVEAIAAACRLLEGQPYARSQLVAPKGASFQAIANRLDLDESAILANLRNVQDAGGITPEAKLETIEAEIETVSGAKQARFPNFSIEMETGTGKTYVYLRTALDLFTRFGLRKFIVVVPSIAVREGVLKTLRITDKHLKEFYGNPRRNKSAIWLLMLSSRRRRDANSAVGSGASAALQAVPRTMLWGQD
jgi:type III restriction enzyme